jgi:hypothetical protein
MCECLIYADGDAYLCVPCADMVRECPNCGPAVLGTIKPEPVPKLKFTCSSCRAGSLGTDMRTCPGCGLKICDGCWGNHQHVGTNNPNFKCARCQKPMQFADGLCWDCAGGDPGRWMSATANGPDCNGILPEMDKPGVDGTMG